MVIASSENLQNFAMCTQRGTWCHQMVWSVCHWPEHCQGAHACTSSIKKWTKVCYMLCSYKCLVTNIWPYLRMMELIFNYCIRWKIGSLNDIGNIMTKLLLMVIMIISHRSQSQSTLASWKAIIFVFFPTFHSNHFNP